MNRDSKISQEPNKAALERLTAMMSPETVRLIALIGQMKTGYLETGREDAIRASIQDNLHLAAMRLVTGDETIEVRGTGGHGDTGSGKTRLLNHVLNSIPIFAAEAFTIDTRPLVSVTAPSPCTLSSLGRLILDATDYGNGVAKGAQQAEIWTAVRGRLRALGTLALHIDEINNLTKAANVVEAEKITGNLKSFLNNPKWPVVTILSGTPEALPILGRDAEFWRRMDWIALESLSSPRDNALVEGTIIDLCGMAELQPPAMKHSALAARLIHATCQAQGWSIEFTIGAITMALNAGAKELSIEHFANCYARRTGRPADQNPFVSADWAHTSPLPPTTLPPATAKEVGRLRIIHKPRKTKV